MDSREFLEQVDWETNIYDVVLVSEETEEEAAKWRVTVKPKDRNDIGSDFPIEIDYYLIDNMGNQFRIIDNEYLSVAGNILVSDDFRCGWCPQPDLTGLIVKSVGNGAAPHVSSAKLDRLDKVAKDAIQNREKDILWKHPKDINEKWHPEGLLFTADPTDNKIINWVDGKIFITLWPENLLSDYIVDNVIVKNAYHPERVYTISANTFTCEDDEQVYIYAKLPIIGSGVSGTIVIEKTYRFERYYTDMLTILLGTYTVPDENGKRSFLMQWGGGSGSDGLTPHIGENGNWWIGETDTLVKAAGIDGEDGREVELSVVGGYVVWRYVGEAIWNNLILLSSLKGSDGLDGSDGLTPFVGENGNWHIGTTDTGIKAAGTDGNDGSNGRGIASILLTNTVGLVKTYTITYTDATTTIFDVTDGEDGDGGIPLTTITQPDHSFIVGNCIKRDGLTGLWILSKADTRENAGTVGIVYEIIDADHFKYITGGLLPGEFVDGADYFLSTTTAGEIFIQSDPEVWEIGNVREFIGTGTPNGLEIEIDLGDEITEFVFTDATIEDIAFDFNDVSGSLQTYYLDVKASFRYKILTCTLESDGSLTGVSIKINGISVTGQSGLTISNKATYTATALNTVEINDVVTLVITIYSGSTVPSLIRGKLKTLRL